MTSPEVVVHKKFAIGEILTAGLALPVAKGRAAGEAWRVRCPTSVGIEKTVVQRRPRSVRGGLRFAAAGAGLHLQRRSWLRLAALACAGWQAETQRLLVLSLVHSGCQSSARMTDGEGSEHIPTILTTLYAPSNRW